MYRMGTPLSRVKEPLLYCPWPGSAGPVAACGHALPPLRRHVAAAWQYLIKILISHRIVGLALNQWICRGLSWAWGLMPIRVLFSGLALDPRLRSGPSAVQEFVPGTVLADAMDGQFTSRLQPGRMPVAQPGDAVRETVRWHGRMTQSDGCVLCRRGSAYCVDIACCRHGSRCCVGEGGSMSFCRCTNYHDAAAGYPADG